MPELKLDGRVIAKFEEGVTECETEYGRIGLQWDLETSIEKRSRQVILECSLAPTLAGGMENRSIQLSRRGMGTTTIPKSNGSDQPRQLSFVMGRRLAPQDNSWMYRTRNSYTC